MARNWRDVKAQKYADGTANPERVARLKHEMSPEPGGCAFCEGDAAYEHGDPITANPYPAPPPDVNPRSL